MDPTLPSLRELELEQLLREREQQLIDLTVECIPALHMYKSVQQFPFHLTVRGCYPQKAGLRIAKL